VGVILLRSVERITDDEQEEDVVASRLILGQKIEQMFLGNDAPAEFTDQLMKLVENRRELLVDIRLLDGSDAITLDLAHAFAGDAVGLADGFQRIRLSVGAETV